MWAYLSGEGENSQADSDDGRDEDGQGLEQLIEVILAHVGAKVVDEAVNLTQAEDSERLK